MTLADILHALVADPNLPMDDEEAAVAALLSRMSEGPSSSTTIDLCRQVAHKAVRSLQLRGPAVEGPDCFRVVRLMVVGDFVRYHLLFSKLGFNVDAVFVEQLLGYKGRTWNDILGVGRSFISGSGVVVVGLADEIASYSVDEVVSRFDMFWVGAPLSCRSHIQSNLQISGFRQSSIPDLVLGSVLAE